MLFMLLLDKNIFFHVLVIGYISCEIDKTAKRVVRRHWPGVIEWGSVVSVTKEMIENL